MAATFDTSEKVTREDVFWFAPQDIDLDVENNGRHDLPDITGLIASIERYGQQTPCRVRKNGQRAVMVEGHSRWRAIVEINKHRKPEDRLKIACTLFKGNEVDALMIGFAANKERNALTPVDEGYFIHRLQNYGKPLDEIAAIVRESTDWCRKRLALVSLTPEAQKAVSEGALKPSAAVQLSKLSADVQRKAVKERTAKGKVKPEAVREAAGKRAPVSLKKVRLELDMIASGEAEFKRGDGSAKALAQWILKVLDGKIALS